jgi:DNA ligase (NAD+)
VRQKDPKVTATRPLTFSAYSLGVYEGIKPKTQLELLETLEKAGLRVNSMRRLCKGLEEVREFIREFDQKRASLDYATDGVVVKVNDFALQNELGYIGRNPRWACAYKFPPDEVVTKVINIDVNIGRTGVLTPMAYLSRCKSRAPRFRVRRSPTPKFWRKKTCESAIKS